MSSESGVCPIIHLATSVRDTLSTWTEECASSITEDDTESFSDLWQCLQSEGIPEDTASIINEPPRGKTNKLYNVVSEQVRQKLACIITEDGLRLEILDLERRGIVLSMLQKQRR